MPEYSAKMQFKVEYLWLERIFAAQLGLAWANIGNALSILLAILLTAHKKRNLKITLTVRSRCTFLADDCIIYGLFGVKCASLC